MLATIAWPGSDLMLRALCQMVVRVGGARENDQCNHVLRDSLFAPPRLSANLLPSRVRTRTEEQGSSAAQHIQCRS